MSNYQIVVSEETFAKFCRLGKHLRAPEAGEAFDKICDIAIARLNLEAAITANAQFAKHAEEWMLHPSSFNESNAVLGPPVGLTEDEVYSLCVAHIYWGTDPAVLTSWKLTQQQLDFVSETGRIWIALLGETIQPIVVMSQNPLDFEHVTLRG